MSGTLFALWGAAFSLTAAPQNAFNLIPPAAGLVAAYTATLVLSDPSLPFAIGFAAAVVVACGYGLAMHLLFVVPLQSRQGNARAILLSTLGIVGVTQSIIAIWRGSDLVSLRSTSEGQRVAQLLYEGSGAWVSHSILIVLIAGLIILGLKRTNIGLVYRAACDNRVAAVFYCLPLARLDLLATALACFVAALAGVLTAAGSAVSPSSGISFAIAGLAASVVGARKNVVAALGGGLILGGLDVLFLTILPSSAREGLLGLAIVAVLLFRPEGVFGRRSRDA